MLLELCSTSMFLEHCFTYMFLKHCSTYMLLEHCSTSMFLELCSTWLLVTTIRIVFNMLKFEFLDRLTRLWKLAISRNQLSVNYFLIVLWLINWVFKNVWYSIATQVTWVRWLFELPKTYVIANFYLLMNQLMKLQTFENLNRN